MFIKKNICRGLDRFTRSTVVITQSWVGRCPTDTPPSSPVPSLRPAILPSPTTRLGFPSLNRSLPLQAYLHELIKKKKKNERISFSHCGYCHVKRSYTVRKLLSLPNLGQLDLLFYVYIFLLIVLLFFFNFVILIKYLKL